MIGGRVVPCLIESGSHVSAITFSCYEEFFRDMTHKIIFFVKLRAANGHTIPYGGYFITNVRIAHII